MIYTTPGVTLYFFFLTFLLGLVFGSFGNAWAWRLVHKESIARGRSHCPACGHTLAAKDLVPLFSYLFLKGRCRYCKAPISRRYPLTEAVMALLFLGIAARYEFSWEALRFLILFFLLFVASLVDLDIMELPDGLLIGAAAASLLRLLSDASAWKSMLLGLIAVSVPLLLVVLVMDRILKKESMGGGDIKLMAVLGLHFGPGLTLFCLILACILGLIAAALLKRKKDAAFPFGPAISAAAWLTALFGTPVINAYLSLF